MENNFFKKNQLTLRGIMVGFIILVLMIPMANISGATKSPNGSEPGSKQ